MSITDNRTDETREIVEELGRELDALDAGKWADLTQSMRAPTSWATWPRLWGL